MKRGLAFLLLLALAWAAPPPILGPALPGGSELRLVSPDLKTVYGAWKVEGPRLLPLAQPLPPRPGERVQLLLAIPGQPPRVFWGVAAPGDILLEAEKERISLFRLLREVYRLQTPERLFP